MKRDQDRVVGVEWWRSGVEVRWGVPLLLQQAAQRAPFRPRGPRVPPCAPSPWSYRGGAAARYPARTTSPSGSAYRGCRPRRGWRGDSAGADGSRARPAQNCMTAQPSNPAPARRRRRPLGTEPRSSPTTTQPARAASMRTEGEQGFERVAYVATGCAGLRDPEAAIEAQDVIDADDPGMGHRGAQHPDERLVGSGAQARGIEGRQVPGLALGAEGVGRRTERYASREAGRRRPSVGPAGTHPHREVEVQAEGHPRIPGRGLSPGHLSAGKPLQPSVVAHRSFVLRSKALHIRAPGGAQRLGARRASPDRERGRSPRRLQTTPACGPALPARGGKVGGGQPVRFDGSPVQGLEDLMLLPSLRCIVHEGAGLFDLQVGGPLLEQSADLGAAFEAGRCIRGDVARLQGATAGRGSRG